LQKTGIGFGGARNVSREGLHATVQLARSVVEDRDCTVIGGHAKGVDMMAHQSALAVNGETILVLPEGALTFRLNDALRSYWAEAKERLVIVTQFAPNEPWHVRNAMARNATVIGLSKAFCVIEAGDETGGTWAAGNTALNKNIPLYVLAYPDPPESAAGNHKLIAKGGIPVPYDSQKLSFPVIDSSPTIVIQNKLL
jgi:DNA processing protein